LKRRHFESLRPVCPVCRTAGRESALELATLLGEDGGDVDEGVLRCGRQECRHEYPIIDGIPLIVPNLRAYVAANLAQITAREDLSETLESVLGDCCGPGSAFDVTRQHLSSYAWDHYGDLDPREGSEPRPGSALALLDRALELAGPLPDGPVLDVGCAVGRTTFALAERRGDLVLGVDLHFAMLRTASRVLRRGVARYPCRRVGLVYDRRELAARFPGAADVDFWCCDATALPFPAATFAGAVGLNVIDCVASPLDTLESFARVLVTGGKALVTTPYDWSPTATAVEAWLGGHSQRGDERGAAEPVLRRLLTPGDQPAALAGLRLVTEEPSLPWRVRLHERSTVEYRVHLVVAEKMGER